MRTKMIMTASALLLGISGILLSFLPDEFMSHLKIEANGFTRLFIQLLSAFYMSYGILNWTARKTLLGGIYNRPIVLGNFMHFFIGAITLVKFISEAPEQSEWVVVLTSVYVIFALLFAYTFKTDPISVKGEE